MVSINKMPQSMRRELHCALSTTFADNANADKVIQPTSAYNPFKALDARQGYWYDQMKSLYTKCLVEKFRYKITLYSGVFADLSGALVNSVDDTSLVGTAIDDIVVRPDAKHLFCHTGHAESSVVLASGTIRTRDLKPYKDWQDADYLADDTEAGGASYIYQHIVVPSLGGAGATTVKMVIELWQDTIFFQPRSQSAS